MARRHVLGIVMKPGELAMISPRKKKCPETGTYR